ncbi:MAG: LysR family transcriptional regulator [Lachnospiraceae bacterium]
MNLDNLKVFHTVANLGKLSLASKSLFVTQSAISQSIKNLEEQVGVRLFDRTSKGVILTKEGALLYKYVDAGMKQLETGMSMMEAQKNLNIGEISIGASDTVCTHYLLSLLDSYRELYPDIKIHIYNMTSAQVIDLLDTGKIEIGFVNMPIKLNYDVSSHHVMVLHDCFVCNKDIDIDITNEYNIKDLLDYPLITLEEGTNMRCLLENLGERIHIPISPSYEVGSSDLLLRFAEKKFGIAYVTREFCSKELEEGILTEIKTKEIIEARNIDLIIKKNRSLSYASKALFDLALLEDASII